MSKYNFIGDLHGLDINNHILKLLSKDEYVILVGDYFDSFNITIDDQIKVFSQLLSIKKIFPDNLILLLGNHDIQYIDSRVKCSGYSQSTKFQIYQTLLDNFENFDISFQVDNIICSHAGISKSFLSYIETYFKEETYRFYDIVKDLNISEFLNFIWKYEPKHRHIFYKDRILNHDVSSPIWIRPKELLSDVIANHIQIVGHTHSPYYTSNNIHFIDCLSYNNYLSYNDISKQFKLITINGKISN